MNQDSDIEFAFYKPNFQVCHVCSGVGVRDLKRMTVYYKDGRSCSVDLVDVPKPLLQAYTEAPKDQPSILRPTPPE